MTERYISDIQVKIKVKGLRAFIAVLHLAFFHVEFNDEFTYYFNVSPNLYKPASEHLFVIHCVCKKFAFNLLINVEFSVFKIHLRV